MLAPARPFRSTLGHVGTTRRRVLLVGATLSVLAVSAGCNAPRRDPHLMSLCERGEFGRARSTLAGSMTRDPGDRSYMLDRVKALSLAMADGVPEAAEPVADRLYDFLRTQDVNAETGVASFLFGEGNARIWKGEPFEQAMTLSTIAVLDGVMGDWGNVRASASTALFQVRDFGRVLETGGEGARQRVRHTDPTDDAVTQREAVLARAGSEDLKGSFTLAASDFELGYVLKALAARQLRLGELEESLASLQQVAPRLQSLAQTIRDGQYNAVLVVEYGLAAEKIATGPDGAIASFRAITASSNAMLSARVDGISAASVPVTTDLNRLARDLRWNSLEDLRRAKSTIGSGLLIGGAVLATASDKKELQIAGLAMILAGALTKATAGADTRYVEVFPQRVYVVPVMLAGSNGDRRTVELAVDGRPESRLVLAGVPVPVAGTVAMHAVRLPARGAGAWATSGRVAYSNDETGRAEEVGAELPWILGGRCIRTPTYAVLAAYQRAGHLKGLSLDDLIDLYRQEGIEIAGLSTSGEIGRHILEGGNWLYTPRAGSTGFARLMGQDHPAYVPRSARVREMARDMQARKR